MHQYSYEGPVMEFDRVIADRWASKTCAPSERKARSNLTYQFKKQYNKTPGTKISLPGVVKLVKQKEHAS